MRKLNCGGKTNFKVSQKMKWWVGNLGPPTSKALHQNSNRAGRTHCGQALQPFPVTKETILSPSNSRHPKENGIPICKSTFRNKIQSPGRPHQKGFSGWRGRSRVIAKCHLQLSNCPTHLQEPRSLHFRFSNSKWSSLFFLYSADCLLPPLESSKQPPESPLWVT